MITKQNQVYIYI